MKSVIIKVNSVSEFSTVMNILIKLGGKTKMYYDDIEYLKTLKFNKRCSLSLRLSVVLYGNLMVIKIKYYI